MKTKQKPTTPEALLLIRIKRDRAKAAMDQIVKRICVISNQPETGLDVLLEYLTNMVYALELLLKVMADDWSSHDVGKMYQKVFDRPHSAPDLMPTLKKAIVDQKFIYEPADRLLDHIPELEALWDELTTEFYQRRWMENTTVQREVFAPPKLMDFLQANLPRFYRAETYREKPKMIREHRIQMLQHYIQTLQSELAQVQAGEEPPEETQMQLVERPNEEYANQLKWAGQTFAFNSRMRNGEFSFGTWYLGKVLPGCLG